MFLINDYIVYGSTGVCKIIDIKRGKFGGNEDREYYILKPVYADNSTIYAPTDNNIVKIRKLLSVDEVYTLINTMQAEEDIWVKDDHLRKEKYNTILKNGDQKQILNLIKSLYSHRTEQLKDGKKFHIDDERIMKEAEKLLCEEFALILNIKPEEVVPFILDKLNLQ